eukprot:1328595-Amorphochlora_amoeboformis.AAC.1
MQIVSYQAGKIETNAAISSNKRLYLATLRVFEEGVYALKLVYRKRDVLYVPPNRVSEIIRDKVLGWVRLAKRIVIFWQWICM